MPPRETTMATCIHCQATSQFLTYDALGLCHHCSPQHAPVLAEAIQGISASAAARTKARTAAAQLEALQSSFEHCAVLEGYSGLQIEGADPAKLRSELEAIRTQTVEQAIQDHWSEARERARDATTPKAMAAPYGKAISKLQDLAGLLDDASAIDRAVTVLRAERDALVFEDLFRQAQLAEQQGRKSKARDLYVEAVFLLRRDGTPDTDQAERITLAETQIERLGGRPA
jgi:hypothetical protein